VLFQKLEKNLKQSMDNGQRLQDLKLKNVILSFLLSDLEVGDLLSLYGQQLMAAQ